MPDSLPVLMLATAGVAGLHTIAGPDHYIPFIALARSRGWEWKKTVWWTIICGLGHVWSSVLLGLLAAAIGWSIHAVGWMQEIRGSFAGWCLLLFGLIYFVVGLVRLKTNRLHKHFEQDSNGSLYVFEHRHGGSAGQGKRHRLTPWVLFIIFILGPCEPIIPLLYLPAAEQSWMAFLMLVLVYSIVTLASMVLMVAIGYFGWGRMGNNEFLQRYHQPIGGAAVFLCGLGMVFFGL